MAAFRTRIACPQKLLIVHPQRHELTRMNLSASPLLGAALSTVYHQIFRVGLERTHVDEINLR
jgi:hypothetical protein